MKRTAEGDHGSIIRDGRSIVTLESVAGVVVIKLNINFKNETIAHRVDACLELYTSMLTL